MLRIISSPNAFTHSRTCYGFNANNAEQEFYVCGVVTDSLLYRYVSYVKACTKSRDSAGL